MLDKYATSRYDGFMNTSASMILFAHLTRTNFRHLNTQAMLRTIMTTTTKTFRTPRPLSRDGRIASWSSCKRLYGIDQHQVSGKCPTTVTQLQRGARAIREQLAM
jgi:hypothetical protein